jgi:hypothetical protein
VLNTAQQIICPKKCPATATQGNGMQQQLAALQTATTLAKEHGTLLNMCELLQ